MAILYKNNAASTLASSITNVATSLTVATGHGTRFPAITGSDYFYVTIISASDPTVFEIVKCTGRSGDVLTIVRAQESTTAAAWSANDRVEQRITAAMLSDALGERLALAGGTLTGASTVSVSTWEKWTLETTGVTAKARQGSDTNGLNFTSNARWTGSAWVEDDSTRKKFAYIQHLGNGRHEFRTSPTGAGVSWTTSLTIDETAVNSTVALTQSGNQVLHAGNYNSYAPTLTGTGASGSWGISVTGNAGTATTLQTARNINGTSFNGSANITTANWGTARTITIGSTGKSVDGSGNVSWTVAEIGALSSSGKAADADLLDGYNSTAFAGPVSTIKQFFWNDLSASGTQARTFEIARLGIDYNDWNTGSGPFEVELYEGYYSRGLKKKYVIHWGYTNTYGIQLVEYSGSGDNNFQVRVGTPVLVSGDNYYLPVFVDVKYYAYVDVVVTTNRDITASNPPAIGTTFINASPSATNIADFTADSTVNFASTTAVQINGNQLLHAANYNSYAPTLTGGGASGTWGISITGNAATATSATDSTKLPLAGGTLTGGLSGTTGSFSGAVTWGAGSSVMNAGNPRSLRIGYSGGNYGAAGYGIDFTTTSGTVNYAINDIVSWWEAYDGLIVKAAAGGTVGTAVSWTTVLDARRSNSNLTFKGNVVLASNNYTSYSPSLTGTGASGTWGISITGNAATATSATDSTKLPLAGGTLTGKTTFPSDVNNRPQIPGGVLGIDTGDGNFDIWGISRDYYPSHATASNAWGIRWDGDSNQVRFIGNGTTRLAVDLDGGASALTWEGSAVLHASNYSSYAFRAVTVEGGITAPAGGLNGAVQGYASYDGYGAAVPNYPNNQWWVGAFTGGNSTRGFQISGGYSDSEMYFRKGSDGWQAWRRVLTDSNYSSYALPLSGGTVTGQVSFSKTDDHAIQIGTIRGRVVGGQSGEYIHLYERVHIGSPSGWGSRNSPSYGLSTYGGADLATDTGSVRITTGSLAVGDAGTRGLILDGNYTNGQFRHRWRKQDDGNGIPLYLDYSHGTANSFTTIARFGGGGSYREFDVYGSQGITGNLFVSTGNSTGGGIILADDGDIVDLNDGYCAMRFSNGVRIHSGNRSGGAAITLGSNGAISSSSLSVSGASTISGAATFNSQILASGRDQRIFENNSFIEFTVGGDANTYYPVRFDVYAWFHFARWSISRGYADTAPWDPIGTGAHRGGLTLTWEWSGDGAWGGNDKTIRVIQFSEQYTTMVGGMALSVNGFIVWLRGGGAYYRFHGPGGQYNGATVYTSTFTASNGATFSPRSYNAGTVASEVVARMPVRGESEHYDGNNRVLHAGNYNSYSPTLTGGNASGTWSINVTGSAGSATSLNGSNYISRTGTSGNANTDFNNTPAGSVRHHGDDANVANSPGGTWWFYDHYRHSNGSNYWGTQIAWGWEDNANSLAQRNVTGGSWSGWVRYLNSGNYSSYALPLSGGTMTGALTMNTPANSVAINFGDSTKSIYTSAYWLVLKAHANEGVKFRNNSDVDTFYINHGASNYDAWFRGNVTAYSDERVKANWKSLDDGFVSRLANIKAGTFTRTDYNGRQAGVSAQSIRDVLPEVVTEDKDGMLSVAYGNAALVSAVELAKEIVKLRMELDELKSKLN